MRVKVGIGSAREVLYLVYLCSARLLDIRRRADKRQSPGRVDSSHGSDPHSPLC